MSISCILLVFLLTGFFLYTYVYKPITYSEEIIIKKQIVAGETFKKDDFDTILQNAQNKKNASYEKKISDISNFFLENRVSTTTKTFIQKNEEKIISSSTTNSIISQ